MPKSGRGRKHEDLIGRGLGFHGESENNRQECRQNLNHLIIVLLMGHKNKLRLFAFRGTPLSGGPYNRLDFEPALYFNVRMNHPVATRKLLFAWALSLGRMRFWMCLIPIVAVASRVVAE